MQYALYNNIIDNNSHYKSVISDKKQIIMTREIQRRDITLLSCNFVDLLQEINLCTKCRITPNRFDRFSRNFRQMFMIECRLLPDYFKDVGLHFSLELQRTRIVSLDHLLIIFNI